MDKPPDNPAGLAIYQDDTFWPIDIANMANTNKPLDSPDILGYICTYVCIYSHANTLQIRNQVRNEDELVKKVAGIGEVAEGARGEDERDKG